MNRPEEAQGSLPQPANPRLVGDPAETNHFWAQGLSRIRRFTVALGIVATVAAACVGSRALAVGVAAGSVLGYLNFRWLTASVEALGERIAERQMRESAATVMARFLLRYVLVAVVGYVIFKRSKVSLVGALAGFCLPVAATLCEAVYELYGAFWRGY
ncbi:MAG: ATP synthase subunit I [Thermoguttaceae bacterium]